MKMRCSPTIKQSVHIMYEVEIPPSSHPISAKVPSPALPLPDGMLCKCIWSFLSSRGLSFDELIIRVSKIRCFEYFWCCDQKDSRIQECSWLITPESDPMAVTRGRNSLTGMEGYQRRSSAYVTLTSLQCIKLRLVPGS